MTVLVWTRSSAGIINFHLRTFGRRYCADLLPILQAQDTGSMTADWVVVPAGHQLPGRHHGRRQYCPSSSHANGCGCWRKGRTSIDGSQHMACSFGITSSNAMIACPTDEGKWVLRLRVGRLVPDLSKDFLVMARFDKMPLQQVFREDAQLLLVGTHMTSIAVPTIVVLPTTRGLNNL